MSLLDKYKQQRWEYTGADQRERETGDKIRTVAGSQVTWASRPQEGFGFYSE